MPAAPRPEGKAKKIASKILGEQPRDMKKRPKKKQSNDRV